MHDEKNARTLVIMPGVVVVEFIMADAGGTMNVIMVASLVKHAVLCGPDES